MKDAITLLNEAHSMLSKSRLASEQYNPISECMVLAKRKLYESEKIFEQIIELKEKERKEWADMCIKKQARIEELEKLLK